MDSEDPIDEDKPRFVFATCQIGAENALKREIARNHPQFRFAFSRPGFLTFKLPRSEKFGSQLDLQSTFVRACGFSLGRVTHGTEHFHQQLTKLLDGHHFDHLHAWRRDAALPGDKDFEPTMSLDDGAAEALARHFASDESKRLPLNQIARPNQKILDCVVVDDHEWWIGFHQSSSISSRWPGGICPIALPENAVSRAYLKMAEAVHWSKLPTDEGDACVEIGSAPGGAAQALLESGLRVIGIDPAEIDPRVLKDPNFTHIRRRVHEVKRRDFQNVRWLVADANIAPWKLLDSIESIVCHQKVHIRGMLLTLKLFDWEVAEQIPDFLKRVRSWGFGYVKSRQLAFNRQEVCLFALRRRALRRVT